jgi:hypothetical protein
MIKIVAKLVMNVRYDGHCANSALPNAGTEIAPAGRWGTCKLNTSNVMATAKTPSLKDSRRPVCFSTAPARCSLFMASLLPDTPGRVAYGPVCSP